MSETAVIVIDMQNDYCHPDGDSARSGGRLLPERGKLIGSVVKLVDGARLAGALVVLVRMTQSVDTDDSKEWRASREGFGLGNLCVPGTWGHQLIDELRPRDEDLVLDKSRFSAFFETGLREELLKRGITHCIFAGVTTNGCVDLSLRDAYQWGFRVTGVSDASGAFDQELHDAALRNWMRRCGEVKTVSEVLETL